MEGTGKKWKEMLVRSGWGAVQVGAVLGDKMSSFFFSSPDPFFFPISGVFLGIAVVSARSHH